jgi:hypothetical protein
MCFDVTMEICAVATKQLTSRLYLSVKYTWYKSAYDSAGVEDASTPKYIEVRGSTGTCTVICRITLFYSIFHMRHDVLPTILTEDRK